MPRRNGHQAIRRMPVRTTRVELEGDYAEFSLMMRSNPPLRVFTDIQANPEFESLRKTIGSLIVDWDFVDDDGQPIPVGDIDALPLELFGMIVTGYLNTVAAATAVPKA